MVLPSLQVYRSDLTYEERRERRRQKRDSELYIVLIISLLFHVWMVLQVLNIIMKPIMHRKQIERVGEEAGTIQT